MDDRLKKQLDFSLEIDKEKNIFRQTSLSGHGRKENDAEHAWHMAIMAYVLKEYANEEIDISKVMIMCLIHDIVEISSPVVSVSGRTGVKLTEREKEALISDLEAKMKKAAQMLEFEIAAQLRDEIVMLRGKN